MLRAIGLLAIVVAICGAPPRARADCDVTDTGIPDDAAFKLDPGGVRKALAKNGVMLSGIYYGESFGNWGGFKQGVTYDGVLDMHLDADMKKLGLWKGLCFHMNAFQIHGRSITADNIDGLMPVSNLEATPATRLDEMWFEQHLFSDKLAVKIGQLAADMEFILSESYSYFLNGTWGWPSIAAADLPGGGPAYPLATPAVRVAVRPSDQLKLMIGVFNGDPADPNCPNPNPQECNSDGLDFSLDSPPLLMIEGRYKYNQSGQLPGVVKVGGWNHFGSFPDQRFDSGGVPIALTGKPGRHIDGDWAVYGIVDQLIWRLPDSKDPKGVGLFGRVMGAPTDQNLVDFYAEGGITFTGMVPHRTDDAIGIGFAYTGISDRVRGFDSDSGLSVLHNHEALLEICYTAQLEPGWTLQPDLLLAARGQCAQRGRCGGVGGAHQHQLLTLGLVYSLQPQSRDRSGKSSKESSQESARRALLAGAIAFGAALPLFAGIARTYGAGGDRAVRSVVAPTTDFTKLEEGEDKPGGGATSRGTTNTPNAFSLSSGNMDFKRELDFKVGNGIFRKNWVSAPSSTDSSDGLGPLFNSRACQNCHLKDGRGHPALSADVPDDSGSMLVRLSVPAATEEEKGRLEAHSVNSIPDPTYGGQLQNFSIQGFRPEGQLKVEYKEKKVRLAGGETASLREPHYSLTDLAYGPASPGLMISPRVAPPMIGLGLLEAVPEEQIVAHADPDDANNDGISGKPNQVWSREQNKVMLGRFGWKAGVPTITQQAAEAFAGDIGLSTTMIPFGSGDCTEKEKDCLDAPNGNSPRYQNVEVGDDLFKMVAFYSRNLAVPARRKPDDPEVLKGKEVFYKIGCTGCHNPKFMTGELLDQPHLSHQLIYPYTDMLLHDMGEGLADHRREGAANGNEWRTPPLWGVGLTQTVSGHTLFLHDGRARNLTEAILWHGGEGQNSRDKFAALSKADRDALLAFVNSL